MEFLKTLFDKKLEKEGFSEMQIEQIKNVIESTCMHCLDADNNCQCWNDE